MPQVQLTLGEQAWAKYKAIEQVTDNAYQLSKLGWIDHSPISMALQILGEAIILQHGLIGKTPMKKWNLHLEEAKISDLRLTNITEMLHATIPSWEAAIPAIPDQQVGHDSWVYGTKGRAAGFFPHPSLYKLAGEETFKEILVKDTTYDTACGIYQRIQAAVDQEIGRFALESSPESLAGQKKEAINNAMARLWKGIQDQYDLNASTQGKVNLYSLDTMLDATFPMMASEKPAEPQLSVRATLNLSRWNPISLFELQPALWGKTNSLTNVEKQLIENG